jgi:alkanesulfonate monooxygenase SsuD/methylene tetrahydromethanopterin reductase-like flavin-dependent oxidoreductase (luciferase family)
VKEAVQIIKGLWTQEKVSFKGDYYLIKDAICNPKPIQKPHPPIWLTARGHKMLRIVAEYADGWNYCNSLDGFKRKAKILDEYIQTKGIPRIKYSWHGGFLVGEDEKKIISSLNKMQPNFLKTREYLKRTHLIRVQTEDDCIDIIRKLMSFGATHFMLTLPYSWNQKEALRCLARYANIVNSI